MSQSHARGPRVQVFSSDHLPADLDDRKRFHMWRDMFISEYGAHEFEYAEDQPFQFQSRFLMIGDIGLGEFTGTITRMVRASKNKTDHFILALNGGGPPMQVNQAGQEIVLQPGDAALMANFERGEARRKPGNRQVAVWIPRHGLLEVVGRAEDLLTHRVAPGHPAVRHLHRYLDMLLGAAEVAEDSLLQGHVQTALLDLVALALDAGRESKQLARVRGLRAARLRMILAEIEAGFADPAFAVQDVGVKLGVSVRYIQDLLHAAGTSFTERVLELRLQKTRKMLARRACDPMTITEIALASGFNEVSHFNRSFRRRFGGRPSEFRRERTVNTPEI